ncbi:pyridoxal-phosphate dependent enzyme [Pandoraea terrae]
MKFECHQPGGNHKTRAARHIVRSALACGALVPGRSTIVARAGVSFGAGLLAACRGLNIPVALAPSRGLGPQRRDALQRAGARWLDGPDRASGANPRAGADVAPDAIVAWHLRHAQETGHSYFRADPFIDAMALRAHELETGPEIATQLAARWPHVRRLSFVACAGTGASLTGIARVLRREGFEVDVTLVEPAGACTQRGLFPVHRLSGMAMVHPVHLDWTQVDAVASVDYEETCHAARQLIRRTGHRIGVTTSACVAVAFRRLASHGHKARGPRGHKTLVVCYDTGGWPATDQPHRGVCP